MNPCRYEDLYEEAPAPYLLVDGTWTVLHANRTFYADFGCSVSDIISRRFSDLVAPESKAAFLRYVRKAVKSSKGTLLPVLELLFLGNGKSPVSVLMRAARESREEGFRVTLFPIAAQKDQEKKRRREREQKLLYERETAFFLSNTSHELRTPLNAVVGFAELLQDRSLSEEIREEYASAIMSSGTLLLQMINDILDLSRLDAKQITFSSSPVEWGQFLREAQQVFQENAREKGLGFSLEVSSVPRLMLDPHRMRQIVFNLIANAVRFTEKGSVTVSSSFLPLSAEEGTLRLSVADTGCGIAKRDLPNIFSPRWQLARRMQDSSGLGLGLCIVRRLVTEMGGSITVKSQLGKGTRLDLRFPRVAIAAEPKGSDVPQRQQISPVKSFPVDVLLVDDVPINRKVAAALLSRYGVRCTSCGSAKEALELLRDHSYAFVLTDIWMPEMNGVQLAEHIAQIPAERRPPVVGVTAATESETAAYRSAFVEILYKPLTLAAFRPILDRFVGVDGSLRPGYPGR